MKLIKFFLSLGLSILLGTAPVFADSITSVVYHSVIDTTKCLEQIHRSIDVENLTSQTKIDSLKRDINNLNRNLTLCNEGLSEVSNFIEGIGSKVKSESFRISADEYFKKNIKDVPKDTILSYCNEKDVNKALKSKSPEEDIAKLIEKFYEKESKRILKGDLSSGFLPNLLHNNYSRLSDENSKISSEILKMNDEIKLQESALIEKPRRFDLSLWKSKMGATALPLCKIKVEVPIFGIDTLSYSGLMNLYYNTPEFREYCKKNLTVEGCFDGVLQDKITIFPYPNSRYYDDDFGDGTIAYRDLLVWSENATVLPALIFSDSDDNFYYINNPSESWTSFSISKLPDLWNLEPSLRDGILLDNSNIYVEGVTEKSYVYNKGNWLKETPFDARFFSFDKCMELMKEDGVNPEVKKMKVKDMIEGTVYDLSVILVDNSKLDFEPIPGEQKCFVKTNPAFNDLELPAENLIGWGIIQDPKKISQQLLYVDFKTSGDNSSNNPGEAIRKVYQLQPVSDCMYSINERESNCGSWNLLYIGKRDSESVGFKLVPVVDEEE